MADVVMLERRRLAYGSSWHAAGGVHTLNADPNMAALQAYTIDLLPKIEKESGQNIGFHMTGGLTLAGTAGKVGVATIKLSYFSVYRNQ